MGRDERSLVLGQRAALALARCRPHAVRRVWVTAERKRDVGLLITAANGLKRPVRVAPEEELRRVAGTEHHEGVVVEADPLPLVALDDLRDRLGGHGVLLALDDVGNPHNLGAILRSAAWFGAAAVLVRQTDRSATLSPAALRVSQGGAEVVAVCAVADLPAALGVLASDGYRVVGADQAGSEALRSELLAAPSVIVLGNEGSGLSPATQAAVSARVRIPGTGAVESLNVAVAAGILLAAALAR